MLLTTLFTSIFTFMGLGGPEIALILFAILLLFGAKKIPELARGMGRGIREFKDASQGIKDELEEGMKEDSRKSVK